MGKKQADEILLEFDYGLPANVDRDVDLFREFYLARFREEALARIVARMKRRNVVFGFALCIAGALFAVPVVINAASVFAKIILAMGLAFAAVGIGFLAVAARAERFCEHRFEKLMEGEFAASRSVTKRVFKMVFTDAGVTVSFGTQSAVKQARTKRYEDIEAVHAADDLLFIKGLTWISRFQMEDFAFEDVCGLLREKCHGRYRVC